MASSVVYPGMRWVIFSFCALIVLYMLLSHVWSLCPFMDTMVLSCFVVISRSNLLWLVSIYLEAWFDMCMIRPCKRVEWSDSMLCIGLSLEWRLCQGSAFSCFLALCLDRFVDAFVYLLGSITCRMFRSCSESLVVVDWIRLLFMKQVLFECIRVYVSMLPVSKIQSGIDAIGSS
jgi:hypothetical protein